MELGDAVNLVIQWWRAEDWDKISRNKEFLKSIIQSQIPLTLILATLNVILGYYGLYFDGYSIINRNQCLLLSNLVNGTELDRELLTIILFKLHDLELLSAFQALRLMLLHLAEQFPKAFKAELVSVWFQSL